MSRNLYGVLGVGQDATEKEITKAFRSRARKLHPDKQPPTASAADKERACKAFQELVAAYEILSDGNKRRRHDLETPDPPKSAGTRQGQQSQQQRQQQQSASGSGAGRASGGARRYVYRDEEDDSWKRPPKKTPKQEEDEKEEERRRKQRESDKRFEGLGSHWVKPPPECKLPKSSPSRPSAAPTTQSRTTPMPKTRVSKPSPEQPSGDKGNGTWHSKQRRSKNSFDEDDDGAGSDASSAFFSDESSVLSFDIHIDLKNYILEFNPVEQEVD